MREVKVLRIIGWKRMLHWRERLNGWIHVLLLRSPVDVDAAVVATSSATVHAAVPPVLDGVVAATS